MAPQRLFTSEQPDTQLFANAAILDLFSRFIVGWAVSAVNDRHLTIKGQDGVVRLHRSVL